MTILLSSRAERGDPDGLLLRQLMDRNDNRAIPHTTGGRVARVAVIILFNENERTIEYGE